MTLMPRMTNADLIAIANAERGNVNLKLRCMSDLRTPRGRALLDMSNALSRFVDSVSEGALYAIATEDDIERLDILTD